jgi:hypothetical protein
MLKLFLEAGRALLARGVQRLSQASSFVAA